MFVPADPGAFAVVFIALYVAHGLADHWLQTDYQAATKGKPGRLGAAACGTHVGVYIMTAAAFLLAISAVCGLQLTVAGVLAGQAVSGVTHYWADRRFTLARFCDRLGKGSFYRLGMPRPVRAARFTDTHGRESVQLRLAVDAETAPVSWDNPSLGTGAYVLDQWWHISWLFVAAIVTVIL
jgi:hypothetical protein